MGVHACRRGLIAADVKFPCNGRHIFEILIGVDLHTALLLLPSRLREGNKHRLIDHIIAIAGKGE